jgi:hypothetical protein
LAHSGDKKANLFCPWQGLSKKTSIHGSFRHASTSSATELNDRSRVNHGP